MFGSKTRLKALRMAENGIEAYPVELAVNPWPSLFNHTTIENIAPTRHNRLVYRGDED
jgi:hypothetical protein